jgi:DNA-binding NarL/FixJ family response regulator
VLRRGSAVKAVIIDHWPMLRLGLSRVLQGIDVRVVGEAAAAVEGLRLARAENADLVLLGDHPGGDAVDAVRQAARLPSTPSVVVLVGQVDSDIVGALLQAGADALLVRSAGPDELADAVGRTLEGERVVSPAIMPLLVGAVASAATPTGAAARAAASDAPAGDVQLTAKEREVLAWLADGRSNQEIADALFVTPATVKTHLAHIYTKLQVKGRQQALARAVALGFIR